MSEQPTPKPLDAEAETKVRGLYAGNDWFEAAAVMDAAHYPNMANCLRKNAGAIRGLIASLDASRAETAALRESLAAAKKMAETWRIRTEAHRQGADALAAELRAKAEQRPRRWPKGWFGVQNGRSVLRWWGQSWSECAANCMKPGDLWLPQPAAPAAKEGT